MRIPLFVAIPLCLLTIALIGWMGTRDMDFLRPPSEARLSEIRAEALASLPVSQSEEDAISIKVPTPDLNPTFPDPGLSLPAADLGDTTSPPVLDAYSDRAPEGSPKLIALAAALEQAGALQRAMLAYERILDLCESDPEQIETAVSAIHRLKHILPEWNADPQSAAQAVIHIGTGEKFAEALSSMLTEMIRDLNSASSGLVRFSHELHIGRHIQNSEAPTPVALWITGSGEGAPSTDVLSFTTEDSETLRNDLLKTTFNLIRGHLSKSSAYHPAPEVQDDPLEALESHITLLLWSEFGKILSP